MTGFALMSCVRILVKIKPLLQPHFRQRSLSVPKPLLAARPFFVQPRGRSPGAHNRPDTLPCAQERRGPARPCLFKEGHRSVCHRPTQWCLSLAQASAVARAAQRVAEHLPPIPRGAKSTRALGARANSPAAVTFESCTYLQHLNRGTAPPGSGARLLELTRFLMPLAAPPFSFRLRNHGRQRAGGAGADRLRAEAEPQGRGRDAGSRRAGAGQEAA